MSREGSSQAALHLAPPKYMGAWRLYVELKIIARESTLKDFWPQLFNFNLSFSKVLLA